MFKKFLNALLMISGIISVKRLITLPKTLIPHTLSNTPANLCMALLNFSLSCFVLYCYVFVQYCNVETIQYNTMHTFVGVLDNPLIPEIINCLIKHCFEKNIAKKTSFHRTQFGITLENHTSRIQPTG